MAAPLFEKSRDQLISANPRASEFLSMVSDLRLEDDQWAQFAVAVFKKHVAEAFTSSSLHRNISINSLDGPERFEIKRFEVSRKWGRKHKRHMSGIVFVIPTRHPDTAILFFVEPPRFWRDVLRPVLESLQLVVGRPFFTQSELHGLLRSLENSTSREIRVLKTSSRERLKSSDSRRRFASSIRWTDTDLSSAFKTAQDKYFFRTVAFELVHFEDDELVSDKIRGAVSKYGYVRCDSEFQNFYQSIVVPMCDRAHERNEFLSNRDRRSTKEFAPKPLVIKYGHDVFEDLKQVRLLGTALKRFKHGTCAVLHGNPYLHVSLLDGFDLSSVDIWVVAKREILIIPQIKTSESALKRVVNHIFENFREGHLGEYQVEK
jgi:hypothetical protein